ncbi:coiled-coil domain-containing protein 38 [Oryzias latipes]|uniref:Uncharacterized protein n=1 Tax=Oryzias latipes TaxID=8090 RepID=A0A3B3IK05_ORYLA|nr:coiled-coil domain-containing protein 38 [Oryzias latipes]
MSKIPAHNLAGMMTKKEEKACTTGNKQLSDKKEVCSKVKQFLLEEEARGSRRRELLHNGQMMTELEMVIEKKNADIKKLNEKIKRKQSEMSLLQDVSDKEKKISEESSTGLKLNAIQAKTILENKAKLECRNRALKGELVKEIKILQSDDAGSEELLNKYKRFRNLISRLSSRECQEAQRTEKKDGQNSELEKTSVCKKPKFLTWKYCIDSIRVVHQIEELENQNLFLMENLTEKSEFMGETIEFITNVLEEEERTQTLKVNSMKSKCAIERRIADIVKKKVQLHNLSTTVDQDVLLETLRKKVSEVHSCFADEELTTNSTLEKLAFIENHMTMLLEKLEKIPKDEIKTLWHIKENEKRSRWREEKLRQETEKREEKIRRRAELAMTEPKRITGRKLMPRHMPVVRPKTKAIVEDTPKPEDDLYEDLFS